MGVGVAAGVGGEVSGAADVGVGVGVSVGFFLGTTTPLFQTRFFPLLIQVYFFPWKFLMFPALMQIAPAFGGVADSDGLWENTTETTKRIGIVIRVRTS